MKIAYVNFWPTFSGTFFRSKLPSDVEVEQVDPDDADLVVYSVFGNEPVDSSKPSVFWSIEGIWDPEKLDVLKYDWAFYFFPEHLVDHPRYMRVNVVPPYLVSRKPIVARKPRFCNFVYRHPVDYRDEFFDLLNEYRPVDSPGLCRNNMEPIDGHDDPMKSRTASDWGPRKLDFIRQYKFTIAIENHLVPGYLTEKMIHPLTADSIPIYWGDPYVTEDFNPACFVNVRDFGSPEEAVERVKEIDRSDEAWASMMSQPKAFSHRLDQERERWREILEQA